MATPMDPSAFVGQGISAVAAQEIAAQVTAGVADANRLLATGMSAQTAAYVASLINTGTSDPTVLADASQI